ncbi:MAG: iron-containing alcohol dehydrogenase [Succinivibrionaceae bacterium]
MFNFNFYNPTKIFFGERQILALDNEIPKNSRILITYGHSAKVNGVIAEVESVLGDRYFEEFGGIEANPKYETLVKALSIIKESNIDYLLAVGGGSVIDATKFLALAAKWNRSDEPWDLMNAPVEYLSDALPLGTVLTLPATGSEMNSNLVISRISTSEKLDLSSPAVFPKFSVLDPRYTLTLPVNQIKNGLADSFVHVTEQYLTYAADANIQDRWAEGIISSLIDISQQVIHGQNDLVALGNFMWSATVALNGIIGIGVPNDWTTHYIGHQITALYGVDHGKSLTAILPSLLRFDIANKRDKLEQLGRRVFKVLSAEEVISDIENFFKSIDMPISLFELGIHEDCIPKVLDNLNRTKKLPLGEKMQFNKEAISEILRMACSE